MEGGFQKSSFFPKKCLEINGSAGGGGAADFRVPLSMPGDAD